MPINWIISGILLFFLTFSCTTEEAKLIQPQQAFGAIFVSADIAGANILLDGQPTGQIAPDTLKDVTAGDHTIQLSLFNHIASPGEIQVNVAENQTVNAAFSLNIILDGALLRFATNPDSASIFIDNVFQGLSPVEIIVLEGNHFIQLKKGSHLPVEATINASKGDTLDISENLMLTRGILVEHFSNTGCIPCVEADSLIEKILHETGEINGISLGYHPNFPAPNDPMYLLSPSGNNARVQYYGVFGAPTIYVDGVIGFGSVNLETRMNDALSQRSAISPPAILEIFDFSILGGNISGKVRIETVENIDNAVLQIALIEREVNYSSPPGINGQDFFFDVFRNFQPDANGTPITLAQSEKSFVPFQFDANLIIDTNQAQVVVFLQNASKEVLQSAWTVYP